MEYPQPATRIFGNIVYEIFPMCDRAVEHSGLIKLMNLYCFLCGARWGKTTTVRTFSGGRLGIIRCVQCIK